MTRAKSDIPCPVAFGLSKEQLARAFDLGMEKFSEILPLLEARGFPKPHPLIGRYLIAEVQAWIAREAGICALGGPESTLPSTEAGGLSPVLTLIEGRLRPAMRNGKD